MRAKTSIDIYRITFSHGRAHDNALMDGNMTMVPWIVEPHVSAFDMRILIAVLPYFYIFCVVIDLPFFLALLI